MRRAALAVIGQAVALAVLAPYLVMLLTALKPGPGKTTVLRVYEAAGKAAAGVTLKLRARLAAANESNLLEDSGRALKIQNDSIRFDLHPFEIKTLKLQLERPKKL